MTKEEIWQSVLAQIQLNISQANFATWFKNTGVSEIESGQAVISTPNSFAKEWLENKYNKIIFKILHGLNEDIKEVKYTVTQNEIKPLKKQFFPSAEPEQLDFQELKVDKETDLNPRYTFENFVVGPFNELAHAAAWAASQNPGIVYNPLFIYGGVGLGKTHLMQAIGNEISARFPNKKVKYISSEKFTAGVVSSIKNHDMESFKSRYREIDILLIDDVQFLAGKEKTQEEFFHTFNALYEANKQITISSDRPPKAIPALAERLRSRFEGGMIADISLPDLETRIAILKAKAQERKVEIADDVLIYIASSIQRNIRELEGALNRLLAHQKLTSSLASAEDCKSLLKNLTLTPPKITTPKKIIQAVSEFYDLKERDLITSSRKKEIVRPRQIAMFLLREELKSSYPFIGRRFGGKDHTTAMHACEKISKEIEKNENIKEEIDLLKQRIYVL
ncbi:MAG: chromosomal replication initiator protein DnaA [Candidatus Nealsonbacteria bacterium CG_4_10_14_0_2_um_filter_38_17]|uniref:Chromosomal replication initiator protein DnaA n=2 Tax=Candidatus Nealsoniibacteriota TaxID=1817911 RepID=A0A2M7UXZ5_9BACT|nr:MAG: chromosomal replication initiator protein DnaA [Candidatus Nealsonbacteria bacterium CG23_combo_of_CG06-09_8_20_14_all_38_19]PIZ88853.1 MAG: chromosomal replication initiator protein DnaA [Candidatus Nealsonbacteria bacterium CG_4_10_14_0_2_um_filter_38_17]